MKAFRFEIRLENRPPSEIISELADRMETMPPNPVGNMLVAAMSAATKAMEAPPDGCLTASVHITAQHRAAPLEGQGHLGCVSSSINWWGNPPVPAEPTEEEHVL